ncbi:MAG TPA: hypothetical protein VFH25_02785 [Nitrososphaeraceae archaeon]|nr:hypothetical protein [Nitrososphaeraceae archaeon]
MTTTGDIKCDDIQESKNLAGKNQRNGKDCLLHVDSSPCYLGYW